MGRRFQLLLIFLFSFSNQLSAIPPEKFRLLSALWIAKNVEKHHFYKYYKLQTFPKQHKNPFLICFFIKSLLSLFENPTIWATVDDDLEASTGNVFLFLEKVIEILSYKIEIPFCSCDKVFSSGENPLDVLFGAQLMIIALLSIESDLEVEMAAIRFCKIINDLTISTHDGDHELSGF